MNASSLQSKATLGFIVLAVGLIGTSHGAIFARMADAHPIVTSAMRVGLAALVVIPFALWRDYRVFATLKRRPLMLAVGAGVFLAAHFATWIASLDLTSIANSVVLVTLNPIWIAFYTMMVTRRLPPGAVAISIMLAVGGSVIIGYGSAGMGGGQLTGDILAVIGGICMSGYLLLGQAARRDLPLLPYVAICYGVAAIILWLAVFAMDLPVMGLSLFTYQAFIGMALFSQVLGHSSYNWALKIFHPGFVAVFVLGEPILSSAFGFVYFGETIGPWTLGGGVLTLAGIAMGAWAELKPRTNEQAS